jgi:two-component system cell cycle response regulator
MAVKVLLADDSRTIRTVVEMVFRKTDIELTSTVSGEAALAAARALRPDVILADLHMEDGNGLWLAEQIQADSDLRAVPVVILSRRNEEAPEDRIRESGAVEHVPKPFKTQELQEVVLRLIGDEAGVEELDNEDWDLEVDDEPIEVMAAAWEDAEQATITTRFDNSEADEGAEEPPPISEPEPEPELGIEPEPEPEIKQRIPLSGIFSRRRAARAARPEPPSIRAPRPSPAPVVDAAAIRAAVDEALEAAKEGLIAAAREAAQQVVAAVREDLLAAARDAADKAAREASSTIPALPATEIDGDALARSEAASIAIEKVAWEIVPALAERIVWEIVPEVTESLVSEELDRRVRDKS